MAEERREPGRVPAIILAVLVHIAFIAVLVFGVDWQNREPAPVVAELWNSLPGVAQPPPPASEPKPAPEPKPEPKPVPPKPEPIPEAKPEPKAVKVDIALKAKEAKRKEEEEKKKELEKKDLEKKKKQEVADEKRREQEDFKKDQQTIKERFEADAREREAAKNQAQQQAAARSSLVNDYKGRIIAKIKPLIVNQPCAPLSNPEVEYEVRLMPDGMVLPDLRLKKSSGIAQCDQAIERAILRAQPLPLPPDVTLFGEFRELNLKFRPNE